MDFHALQIVSTLQTVRTETMDACLKTNDPIFAEVTLAGSVKARMECDTPASHSVMSEVLYKELKEAVGDLQGKK